MQPHYNAGLRDLVHPVYTGAQTPNPIHLTSPSPCWCCHSSKWLGVGLEARHPEISFGFQALKIRVVSLRGLGIECPETTGAGWRVLLRSLDFSLVAVPEEFRCSFHLCGSDVCARVSGFPGNCWVPCWESCRRESWHQSSFIQQDRLALQRYFSDCSSSHSPLSPRPVLAIRSGRSSLGAKLRKKLALPKP